LYTTPKDILRHGCFRQRWCPRRAPSVTATIMAGMDAAALTFKVIPLINQLTKQLNKIGLGTGSKQERPLHGELS